MARVDRRLDLAHHLGGGNERLAVEVAAALREVLVLELDGVGAGALHLPHRAPHVERVAVAGVGVHDQVGADAVADQRDGADHLAHADEPDIRPPELAVGDGGARDVQRAEAGLLGDQRGERVVDAGREHNRRPREADA